MSKILEKIKILSWVEIEYLILALFVALLLIFFKHLATVDCARGFYFE